MNALYAFTLCFALLTLALSEPRADGISASDIGKSIVSVAKGIASKIPDVIPSTEELLQTGKNIIVGYPFDVAFRVLNRFCAAALSAQSIMPKFLPEINKMNFVLKTKDKNISVPLEQPQKLWSQSDFKKDLPLVVMITGWKTNFNETNDALDTVFNAYKCRGNVNFVAIDSAAYVDTLYSWSAFNTEEIGKLIATALELLIETYPIEKIHIIGHSLGAHIAGAAGRHFSYKTRKLIPRITGLDPANPCFNGGQALTGLARGDAEFVDVIHSNSGALGKRDSIGDADFYPNGLDPLPPGCLSMSCAHGRAYEYYAESVYPGNENTFLGIKCTSLTALTSNFCPGKSYPMGYAVPTNLKGNYFLKTNAESPYAILAKKDQKPTCAA